MSKEAVDKGHHAWLDAMKANDPEGLGRIVADDVVLMPPHDQPVTGRRGVVDWFGGVVKQARTVAVSVPQREVIAAGSDWAFERGSFTWSVVPSTGGSQVDDRGNFLAVWQRQPDGSWKLTRNIWNSTLPVAAVT
jgi:ketosteroid isomerase-like protein